MPNDLTYRDPRPTSLYGYALLFPDRDPLYLPLGLFPNGAGSARNVTLAQPPFSESTFLKGDGKRKVTPLVLTGTTTQDTFSSVTEDEVRLYFTLLTELTPRATGVQRGQSNVRALWPLGYFTATTPTDLFTWPYSFTLFPTGPDWINTTTGARTPL